MAKEKDPKPRIEILLDAPYLFLKGVGVDVEPTRLSGHVAIYLSEATPIKEITLQFRGKARLPLPSSESIPLNSAPLTYIVCSHDWSFLEGDKHTSHTLKAGRHLFPFQLRIGGSLPSTIASPAFGGAAVTYKLRAQVVRSGFFNHWQTYQAGLPVHIIRSFAPEAMEYQQSLEIENTWPEKLMYSIMVPHKAWAAGDKLTALVKFSPLVKGICVLSVNTSIHEQTKVYARSGTQEHTRLVCSTMHEIVNGRAVEIEGHRSGHSHTPSNPSSPASPATPPSGFINAHRSNSSSSLSSLGRQYFSHTPLHSNTPTTSTASTTTTPVSEVPRPGASTSTAAEELSPSEPDSQDVVSYLSLQVPLTITPTHSLDPIIVSHRIRWSILILNLDGHTSELRCSLPLHLLDYRLLNESRNFSAATRRLLIGGAEVPSAEEEDVQLPSYNQHIRDRVANMFLPDSATMRVTNPWITQRASPVHPPDAPSTFWPVNQSGTSSPLEAHLLNNLPHQPDPNAANTPLEWVNSELLLSLTSHAPPRLAQREVDASSQTLSRTNSRSRPGSRVLSRMSSRTNSPERGERGRERDPHSHHGHETYVHNHGQASRSSHGLFSATMKPFTSFHPGGFLSRSSSTPHLPSAAEIEAASRPMHPVRTMVVDRSSGTDLLHRAFTEVPDYGVASRGFIGGVPPLSSMEGLPSYDETIRSSIDGDVTRRLGELALSSPVPTPPPSTSTFSI
ncbi:hypothetical protein C0991_002193 [Blastosporella zonata]|nr:hypothetical protein C0991_002193 [Blastosporella zonata]